MNNKQYNKELVQQTQEVLETYYNLTLRLIKDRKKDIETSIHKTPEEKAKAGLCLKTLDMAIELTHTLLQSLSAVSIKDNTINTNTH